MTYIMIPPVILTILISSAVNASMSIANSGVRSIGRLDAGMIFFVELVNEGKQEIAVSSRMIGCCEIVTIEDIECEHIQLIGEVVTVESQGIKNVTLIWPTLYLHDRRGECAVSISVESGHDVEETRRKIRFNTMVTGSNPNVLEEYYDAVDVRQCSSPDQDTLDACHPVNCQIKYNGQRNYFDRQLQRCQSVPVCLADPNKELPDVVYDAINNTCRNMENLVTQEEIQSLSGGAAEVAWRSESKPKIRIAAVLIVLIVVFYCITTLLMGVLPEKVKIERSQQTVGLPCFDGPSKSLTSCCSTRPVSRKQGSNASNITYSRLSNRSLHSTKP